jgi:hypothetical protein
LNAKTRLEFTGWPTNSEARSRRGKAVADALQVLASTEVEGAALDINLRGKRVYAVADMLPRATFRSLFASG